MEKGHLLIERNPIFYDVALLAHVRLYLYNVREKVTIQRGGGGENDVHPRTT